MDISAVNWNEVDASNSTAAPDGAPEGMMSSGVNNVLRAHQGAIKRNWKRNSVMVTAGTAAAYTVTHAVPPTALADGETDLVSFHAANSAGATLNVGGLGAKPLHYYAAGAWRLVPAGLLGANQVQRVAYNTAAGAYRLIDLMDRTGELVAWAGATAPSGSLFCFGQAISRTDYAGLFAALATTHGVGDGTSTFNLPDLRGRAVAGKSNMGGSDAGNLTGGATLGAGLGAQSTSTTGTGNASVNGSTQGPSANHTTLMGGGGESAAANFHGHVISFDAPVTIATAAFGIVQPTRVLNFVIRI
jgi:microcystin-dependent protein